MPVWLRMVLVVVGVFLFWCALGAFCWWLMRRGAIEFYVFISDVWRRGRR